MQYLQLIYHNEAEWEKKSNPEREPIYGRYRQLMQELSEKRKYLGGNQLKPTGTATTLRMRNGKELITDGPLQKQKSSSADTS